MASRRDHHNFTLVTSGTLLPPPENYCTGCGYFHVAKKHHRDDCTAQPSKCCHGADTGAGQHL